MNLSFDTKQSFTLEDDRIIMRPLLPEDLVNLQPFAIQEPEIWKYSMVPASGEEGMKKYVEAAVKGRSEGLEYPFIVFDKKTDQYAGSSRFYDINQMQRTVLLGYTWYGQHFQGTGLNKHCKYLLLSFAFDQLGFERIEFRADSENERSIRAMKRIGCQVEGLIRSSSYRMDGSRRDSIVLSILKEEWNQGVREALFSQLDK